MKNRVNINRFCTALLLVAVTFNSLAQVPKGNRIPDARYGEKGFRTESTDTKPTGETETTHEFYEVRIVDGKSVELLRERWQKTVSPDEKDIKEVTTQFHNDGTTEKTRTEIRKVAGHGSVYFENKEFSNTGWTIKATKHEKGLDMQWREFEFDYKLQMYNGNSRIIGSHKVGKTAYSSGNGTPGDIFGGYYFVSRDFGDDRLASHGFNGTFTWYFRSTFTEFPIGLKVSASTATHKSGDEKMSISNLIAGPVIRLNTGNENIVPSFHIMAGISRDGFKIENIKNHGTSFAMSAGGNLDWYFTENIGLRFSPEALLTKFNDQTEWHFLGALGIAYRLKRK